MTTFLLIRHGETATVNRIISGRGRGVHLSPEGEVQVWELTQRLVSLPIAAVCSSPMERTRETAAPIAESHGVDLRIVEGFNEVDAGEWTGREIDELRTQERWRQFNLFRSGLRIPGGEMMVEVQERVVRGLESLRGEFPGETVAVVSHGDVIRSALAHYAAIPFDLFLRVEISPASVTILSIGDWGPRIHCVNHTGDLGGALRPGAGGSGDPHENRPGEPV